MRLQRMTFSAAVLVCVGLPVWAADLNPPAWRGQPGSTTQGWEFGDDSLTPPPDFGANPYGTVSMEVQPGAGMEWLAEWEGRSGIWPLAATDGAIEADIPNRPEGLDYKDIWIQLIWAPQESQAYPSIEVEPVFPGGGGAGGGSATHEPLDDTWFLTTAQLNYEPNPISEMVRVTGAVMVDELVIDTICAPEPAMLWLALGGLAVVRRRRR